MTETTAQTITQLQSNAAWYAKEQKKEDFAINVVLGLVFAPMFGTLAYVAAKCFSNV